MSNITPPVIPSTKTNALSIVSLVTGILGILSSCLSFFLLFPLICAGLFSPAALITGIIGLNQIKKHGEQGRGMAIAGTIMGGLNTFSSCILFILMLLVVFGILSIPFLDPSTYGIY